MKKVALAAAFVFCATAAFALALTIPRPRHKANTVTDVDPKKLFRPQLGTTVPATLSFRDEEGARVTMGQYGKDRPYIIVPVYLKCPSLCNLVLKELVKGLQGVAAYTVGKDFDVVVVSFDEKEPPALAKAKKATVVEEYGRPDSEAGWHFLTGDQENIDGLLDSVGYKVQWDKPTSQYLHASGIVICSPNGTIVRYFPGLDYRPLYLRLALTEASDGTMRMGVIDQVLLPCFRFDETKGQYSTAVLTLVKASGVAMLVLIGMFWLGSWLIPRRKPPLAVATNFQSVGAGGPDAQPGDGIVGADFQSARPGEDGHVGNVPPRQDEPQTGIRGVIDG